MSIYYGVPSTPNDSFLAHYGVKGMKWGVRRAIEKGSIKKTFQAVFKGFQEVSKIIRTS